MNITVRNLSLSCTSGASSKCQYVFFSLAFISKYFLISFMTSFLIPWFLRSVLFNFHAFVNFPSFLCYVSDFIALLTGKILHITSVHLYLLRLVLLTNMWCVLENVLCAFPKNVFPKNECSTDVY